MADNGSRAAADRFASWDTKAAKYKGTSGYEPMYDTLITDVFDLARSWVIEHPADDIMPTDFDWLASQCEQETGEDDVWWNKGCVSFTCDSYQSDPGEPWVTVASDWQVEGEHLPHALVPKTRGQFRRLCEMANGSADVGHCDLCNGTGFPGTTERNCPKCK